MVAGRIGNTTATFIKLLVSKGRENVLPEITNAFIEQYNAVKEIYRIKLTTAAPVGDDVKDYIVNKVKSNSAMQNIELETVVNEELIGGFTLEVKDTLVDASILRDLKDIQKQFLVNVYVQKIR